MNTHTACLVLAQTSTDSKLVKWVVIVIWVAILVGGGVLCWIVNKANKRAAQEQAQRRRLEKMEEAVRQGSVPRERSAGAGRRSTPSGAPQRPGPAVAGPPVRQPGQRPPQRPGPPRAQPVLGQRRPAAGVPRPPGTTPHLDHAVHVPLPSERPHEALHAELPSDEPSVRLKARQAEQLHQRFAEQAKELSAAKRQLSQQHSTIRKHRTSLRGDSEPAGSKMTLPVSSLSEQLEPKSLRQVILLNEIIGPPMALRNLVGFSDG